MIHHTGNVVEDNSSPPNSSSSSRSSPPSSSISNDRRDVIAIANTTNATNNQDYEDAKIPRSSFSKGFTFFEKAPRNNHQALTLLSPKKAKSESESKLSFTKKKSLQQYRSLSPPPPSSTPSPPLSSLLFSPTPPSSSSLLFSPSSSSTTAPPKQPQRKKAATTDRSSSTYSLSSSVSVSSSVSSSSLPEDRAPLSLLLPSESRSFPGNNIKDSTDDDDNEASFSEFNEDDIVGDHSEKTIVTPKTTTTVVLVASSPEHQLSGKTKEKKKNKKKKKKQNKTKKLHRCVPTTTRVTRVTFSKKVRVRKIARLLDMDSQDKHATYYSHDEMVQTRNMLRATIRVINEDYQQQHRNRKNNTKRELDDPTTQTQKIENDITLEHEKEQSESESLFCAAYNDKNCDCCRPIIQNNNDCDEDDDQDQNESSGNSTCSGENNYQWNDNTFCLRGLEVEFPTGKQRRRRNKTIARDMVFEEQRYYNTKTSMNNSTPPPTSNENKNNDTKMQQQELEEREKKEGKVERGIEIVEDPVLAIAEVYRIESIPALQRALEIGTHDAFIAHCIYNNNQQQQQQEQ